MARILRRSWAPQLGHMSAMTKAFIQVIQPIKLYRFYCVLMSGGGRYTPFFCSGIGRCSGVRHTFQK